MSKDDAPWGSVISPESSWPEYTDALAAWKLNNCKLLVDQSVRFVTAACLQKALSFDNQTSEFVVSLEDKQLILQQIFPVMREMGG